MGFSEVILVLLALGGFGVQANPAAPGAAEVLRYAPEEVDLIAHADIEAVVPRNYELFKRLPNEPTVKAAPEAQKELARAVAEAEKELGKVKQRFGIDLTRDVRSVTLFLTVRETGPPQFLVVGRGKFGKDLIDRIAAAPEIKKDAKIEKLHGRTAVGSPDGVMLFTLAADGSFLGGTPAWVRERAGATWTPKAGGVPPEIRAALEEKPLFVVASRPRAEAARVVERLVSDPEAAVVRDFYTGHDLFMYVTMWNGVSWTYAAKTAQGYQRAVMASDGVIQLMRAGHLTLRGIVKVGLAIVDSYAGAKPEIAAIVKHKADLLRIVETWSGDGNFTASVDRKEAERRVTVRLTGKSLAEVMPASGLLLLGGFVTVLKR